MVNKVEDRIRYSLNVVTFWDFSERISALIPKEVEVKEDVREEFKI